MSKKKSIWVEMFSSGIVYEVHRLEPDASPLRDGNTVEEYVPAAWARKKIRKAKQEVSANSPNGGIVICAVDGAGMDSCCAWPVPACEDQYPEEPNRERSASQLKLVAQPIRDRGEASYIAHPYSAGTGGNVLAGVNSASSRTIWALDSAAGLTIWAIRTRRTVVPPLQTSRGIEDAIPESSWLAHSMSQLRLCTELVIPVGAEDMSNGCAAELRLAKELGLTITRVEYCVINGWVLEGEKARGV